MYFNENSPNSSSQFLNDKVKVYSNFASWFIVMKDNSSIFFLLKTLYFGQKVTFRMVGWKFTKFLMSCLKLQVSFSLKGSSIYDVHKNSQFFDSPPHPYPLHSQNWTIDLLFKNNRIRKHVTNFKTPPPPFRVGVRNLWSLSNGKAKISSGSC